MFGVLLFLHIALIFTGLALAYVPMVYFIFAVRSNRTEAIRAVGAVSGPTNRIFPVFLILGGVFGLLTAINAGFNLLAPWLVIAYVLFAVLTAIGAGYTGPYMKRVGDLAAAGADGALSADLNALIRNPAFIAIELVDFGLLLFLIYDMVAKPFG